MNGHLLLIVITGFILFFIFFGVKRKRKVSALLREDQLPEITRLLRINFTLSWLCLVALFFASLCYVLFPGVYLYHIASLDVGLINAAGAFLIKIAFILLIGSGIYISKDLDELSVITPDRIRTIELLSLLVVSLLALGLFVFASSLFTFFNFLLSVVSLLIFRKNLKILYEVINQDRTDGASQ